MHAEVVGFSKRKVIRDQSRWVALALVLLLGALPATAHEKREVPDYDGRPPESADASDVALWVPRIVLSPLYLVSEYLVRRPLGALFSIAERGRPSWPVLVYEALTFGERRQGGLFPVGYIDFGFRPSVGVRFFWNDDALVQGNNFRAAVAYGGSQWLLASITDRYDLSEMRSVELRPTFRRRPDYLFHGLGPRSEDDTVARYGLQQLEAIGEFEQRFGSGASALRLSGGVRAARFRDETCCDDPSVEELVEAGVLPGMPGIGDDFTAPVVGVELALDSRKPPPERRWIPGRGRPSTGALAATRRARDTGALMRLRAENTFRLLEGENAGWVRYGGHLEGFLGLAREARVLSLALDAEMVDPVGTEPVPFFELAWATGSIPLAAFRPGRLVDRSAVALVLRYSWPVWSALDGQLTLGAGNVFGERLEGFSPDLLRLSAALGVTSEDLLTSFPPVELLLGVGSEPLEGGLRFSSLRFVVRAAL